MGILANTSSICLLQVKVEFQPTELVTFVGNCLANQAFTPIDQTADERSIGWVQFDNLDCSDFSNINSWQREQYLTLKLRKDQRKVPSALLKKNIAEAQEKFLSEHPTLNRVPKGEMEEIRECVKSKLLAQTFPTPATTDVVWDTEKNLIYLTALGKSAVEEFVELFNATFEGMRVVPFHPFAQAESVTPDSFQPALAEINKAQTDSVLELIESNDWIGKDFLHWLLYRTMESDSRYQVSQPGVALVGDNFTAYLDDKLTLLGGGQEGAQKIVFSGKQDHFSEVLLALQKGKQICEGKIHFEGEEYEYRVTLKGQVFHFASFKQPGIILPDDTDLTDEACEKQAMFYERMGLLERGFQYFYSLFAKFMVDRLSIAWPDIMGKINAWQNAAFLHQPGI